MRNPVVHGQQNQRKCASLYKVLSLTSGAMRIATITLLTVQAAAVARRRAHVSC